MANDPFGFLRQVPAAGLSEHRARSRLKSTRSSLVFLAALLVSSGLSSGLFHVWLMVSAQEAKKHLEGLGEIRAHEVSVELALAETAKGLTPWLSFLCVALSLWIVVMGFVAKGSPYASTVQSLICLAAIIAMSITLPFVGFAPSGGIYYIAFAAGDFLAIAIQGRRAAAALRASDSTV